MNVKTKSGLLALAEDPLLSLQREAARSDRLFAADLLNQGRGPDALVHLARAITYDPTSTLAAEIAVVALNTWSHSTPSTICLGHTGTIETAVFSPDGSQILTASNDGTARIWDARTGESMFTLIGHSAEVNTAHFSPDGEWVVTASEDKTARIWSARTGKIEHVLEHEDDVTNACFSPNGQAVLTGSSDFLGDCLSVWQVGTWELKFQIRSHCLVYGWQTSSNGELLLLVGDQGNAEVWEMWDAKLLATLQHVTTLVKPPAPAPEEPTEAKVERHYINAQFSADGHWVITSGEDGMARVWNSRTGEQIRAIQAHAAEIRHTCFSRDREWILTASEDKTAKVWSAKTGRSNLTLQHPEPVWEAHFCSDDLKIITITRQGSIRVWSALTGALLSEVCVQGVNQGNGWVISPDEMRVLFDMENCSVRVFELSGQRLGKSLHSTFKNVIDAQFSPDCRRLLTSHTEPLFQEAEARFNCEQVWDVGSGRQLATLSDAGGCGGFSPDGTHLITCSYEPDLQASVWDADTGERRLVLGAHEGTVCAVAYSPNGRQVATSSLGRTVRLWDAATGRLQRILSRPLEEGAENRCSRIIYSPDGNRILTFTETTAFLIWDAQTGELLWTLDGQEKQDIRCWAWTPDSECVAIGSENYTAKIWDARTGQRLLTIEVGSMPRSIVFDSAGRHIAIATWDDVRVWDAVTGARIHPPHRYGDSAAWGCWFRISPGGRRVLACTSGEFSGWLWNVETGTKLVRLREHEEELRSAEFSPDGRYLVTASFDSIALLWELLTTVDPPPIWFPDFLRLMAQKTFNDDGELVHLSAAEMLRLRKKLADVIAGEDSQYASIARRLLALAAPQRSPLNHSR